MAYATITLVDAKAALAARLGNPTKTFWNDTELGEPLAEAQRTYNALTGFWKERGVFNTDSTKRFYNIASELPALLGYTVTNRDVILEIQRALVESTASQTTWFGTEMFTLDDVWTAIERRRNQFLVETGMVLSERLVNITAPPGTRTTLPAAVISLRRVAWNDQLEQETVLTREDNFSFTTFAPGWNLNPVTTPLAFSVGVVPPLTIQIAPAPLSLGDLRMLTVELGASMNPVASTLLGIPDDWYWVVKFGALADLLMKDGLATDPGRAQYCEGRYREGVAMASVAPGPVLAGTINDVELTINTIDEADRYIPGWGNNTTDPPALLAMAGRNMLGVVPRAPATVYGISLDVIRNAPVNQTYLQVAEETFDAILDYAEHLGTFKLGGEEFARSQALLDRFYRFCGFERSVYKTNAPNADALTNTVERNEQLNPRTAEITPGVGLG